MNAQQIENQEIWKQVKGSEKLFEIYKDFPTLHDATIRNIEVNLERKEFYLTVDYSDLIGDSNKSIKTRFTICWRNVQRAEFNWYAEDLYGMKFSKEGDFVKTKLTDYSFGFDGEIVSSEVEVIDTELKPEKDEINSIRFSIK